MEKINENCALQVALESDIKAYRKAKNTKALSIILTLFSEIISYGKNNGNTVTPSDKAKEILNKFIKNIRSNIEILEKANRTSEAIYDNFKFELGVLQEYLPKQKTDDELSAIISEMIVVHGKEQKNMKVILTELKNAYDGQYNPQSAAMITKKLLSN